LFKEGEEVDIWRPYDIQNPLASPRFAHYWKGPTWSINTTLRSPIWSLLSLGQKEKEKMSLLTILEDMERNPLAYG
jgi:hypothetical protein